MTLDQAIESIKSQAIELWGDRYWLSQLVRAWAIAELGEDADPSEIRAQCINRRNQIERVFLAQSCNGDTLFKLADLVGCEIKITLK